MSTSSGKQQRQGTLTAFFSKQQRQQQQKQEQEEEYLEQYSLEQPRLKRLRADQNPPNEEPEVVQDYLPVEGYDPVLWLPIELTLLAFDLLDLRERIRCRRVCRLWRDIFDKNPYAWSSTTFPPLRTFTSSSAPPTTLSVGDGSLEQKRKRSIKSSYTQNAIRIITLAKGSLCSLHLRCNDIINNKTFIPALLSCQRPVLTRLHFFIVNLDNSNLSIDSWKRGTFPLDPVVMSSKSTKTPSLWSAVLYNLGRNLRELIISYADIDAKTVQSIGRYCPKLKKLTLVGLNSGAFRVDWNRVLSTNPSQSQSKTAVSVSKNAVIPLEYLYIDQTPLINNTDVTVIVSRLSRTLRSIGLMQQPSLTSECLLHISHLGARLESLHLDGADSSGACSTFVNTKVKSDQAFLMDFARRCTSLKQLSAPNWNMNDECLDMFLSSNIPSSSPSASSSSSLLTSASSINSCMITNLELRLNRQITDAGVETIALMCPHLRNIDLYACYQVTGRSAALLVQYCNSLTVVNFGRTSIDNRFLDALVRKATSTASKKIQQQHQQQHQRHNGLQIVDLERCPVTEAGLMRLAECPAATSQMRSVNLINCELVMAESVSKLRKVIRQPMGTVSFYIRSQ
ncbi:hypothetical protein GQ42DRAFT_13602 [Ramicandelaber brevisporus]|nr:hypothetical protein GQ42DRAFT_13602 [Ramicandelaber brevisporus]